MEYRDFYDDSGSPHAAEFIFKSVDERRVGHQIIGGQSYRRKKIRADYVYFLAIDFRCQFQTLQLFTVAESRAYVRLRVGVGKGQVFHAFIGQLEIGFQRKTTELAQKHFREVQAIIYLSKHHFGFVHLHFDT